MTRSNGFSYNHAADGTVVKKLEKDVKDISALQFTVTYSQDLHGHDGHSPASWKMAKQVGETLTQVYSALSNGDSGLARTLLSIWMGWRSSWATSRETST
jgi:hypothetical protein